MKELFGTKPVPVATALAILGTNPLMDSKKYFYAFDYEKHEAYRCPAKTDNLSQHARKDRKEYTTDIFQPPGAANNDPYQEMWGRWPDGDEGKLDITRQEYEEDQ